MFKYSAMLVNSQLVSLPQVEVFKNVYISLSYLFHRLTVSPSSTSVLNSSTLKESDLFFLFIYLFIAPIPWKNLPDCFPTLQSIRTFKTGVKTVFKIETFCLTLSRPGFFRPSGPGVGGGGFRKRPM